MNRFMPSRFHPTTFQKFTRIISIHVKKEIHQNCKIIHYTFRWYMGKMTKVCVSIFHPRAPVVSTVLFLILFVSFPYCGVYQLKHNFLFLSSSLFKKVIVEIDYHCYFEKGERKYFFLRGKQKALLFVNKLHNRYTIIFDAE